MMARTKDWCPACRMFLDVRELVERHNVKCAEDGERSYAAAVNVRCRTTTTERTKQGAGIHAKGAYEL